MPRQAEKMDALEVKRLTYKQVSGRDKGLPVFKAVGGVAGLHLQLTDGEGRSWVLRYSLPGGRRRSTGLGAYPEVGLADARDRAREAKDLIKQGKDPIVVRDDRRKALEAELNRMTFAQAIDGWDREHPHQFTSAKHRRTWLASVRDLTSLQAMPADRITREDIWAVLEPKSRTAADTANRIRGRIETVLNYAEDENQLSGPNPAAEGWLKRKLMAKTAGIKKGHRPALAVEDAPRWFAALKEREGMGSRALEFLTLTGVRSGEVRGAAWGEIDFDAARWTIPAERMKMKRGHIVPLSSDAMQLLNVLPRLGDYVFTAPRGGQLSDMTLSAGMKRIHGDDGLGFVDPESGDRAVPHGLRSTFRMWAGQRGYNRELAELALAHQIGNAVEQAYQRDSYVERRRPMMQSWADYLQDRVASVVQLHG